MHIPSSFVSFSLLALLVSNVLATNYYRADARKPKDLKAAGGFKSRGDGTIAAGDLFKHVEGTYKPANKDPFISTTSDIDYAKKHLKSGYVYTLDSADITEKIHDVAQEYEDAKKKYTHSEEKEFSVEHSIPWAAVTKIEKKVGDEWKTVKPPTKRAPVFLDDDDSLPDNSVSGADDDVLAE